MVVRKAAVARKPRAARKPYGRTYHKAMSGQSEITVQRTTTGLTGGGGGDLAAAAQILADKAKEIAGGFSRTGRLPESIAVDVEGNVATISADAPSAYPNEIEGVRHPVFARGPDRRKWTWVTNQYRPFLSLAVDEKSDDAAKRYAQKIDRALERAGFREDRA